MVTANTASPSPNPNGNYNNDQRSNSHGRGGQSYCGGHNNNNRGRGRNNYNNDNSQVYRDLVICQVYGKQGHTAPRCYRLTSPIQPAANTARTPTVANSQPQQGSWLVDSGASHSLSVDLNNLTFHTPNTMARTRSNLLMATVSLSLTPVHLTLN